MFSFSCGSKIIYISILSLPHRFFTGAVAISVSFHANCYRTLIYWCGSDVCILQFYDIHARFRKWFKGRFLHVLMRILCIQMQQNIQILRIATARLFTGAVATYVNSVTNRYRTAYLLSLLYFYGVLFQGGFFDYIWLN